ncbi:Uncharacterised protein [uncultured archaeon]|nr:Uncharacterised protein [uncultured archaeon]
MFSLDIFDGGYGFWGTIAGLFMHNIPTLILLFALIISWKKYELVGAITFLLSGGIYIIELLITISMTPSQEWYMLFWALIIAGPAFLVGSLFLINWLQKKKNKK